MDSNDAAAASERPTLEIDAIVTWVDGGDPNHIAKRIDALRSEPTLSMNAIPGGRDETRFAYSGEIFFCLELLRKNCSWIRTIYLLTDDQQPGFLTPEYCRTRGVVVVDHRDVFEGYEWALPTFNSQSIETVMHRIKGLSENFVYLNDDFFVLKPTDSSEFFNSGCIVLRGVWGKIEKFGFFRRLMSAVANHVADKLLGVVRPMAVLAQYRAAQLAGYSKKLLLAPHTPYPVRKTTLVRYYERNKGVLEKNIKYKFRNMEQFVPMSLANHLELSAGKAVVSPEDDYMLICINRAKPKVIEDYIRLIEAKPPRFLCVQGLELATDEWRNRIERVLREANERRG